MKLWINDVEEPTSVTVNGVRVTCPFYIRWSSMIRRCYSESYIITRPTYRGCSVCDDWLRFSNFKSWMQKQDWEGKDLDKDIIIEGNKVYDPETCAFVSPDLNKFLNEGKLRKKDLPTGVSLQKNRRYRARINNLEGMVESLGQFDTAEEAHNAWKIRKKELAMTLSTMHNDVRLSAALLKRYN